MKAKPRSARRRNSATRRMTRFPSTRLPRRLSFGALYGVRDGESKNETVHRENANHRHMMPVAMMPPLWRP
jgi:hypothetical protein